MSYGHGPSPHPWDNPWANPGFEGGFEPPLGGISPLEHETIASYQERLVIDRIQRMEHDRAASFVPVEEDEDTRAIPEYSPHVSTDDTTKIRSVEVEQDFSEQVLIDLLSAEELEQIATLRLKSERREHLQAMSKQAIQSNFRPLINTSLTGDERLRLRKSNPNEHKAVVTLQERYGSIFVRSLGSVGLTHVDVMQMKIMRVDYALGPESPTLQLRGTSELNQTLSHIDAFLRRFTIDFTEAFKPDPRTTDRDSWQAANVLSGIYRVARDL